ncbi:MAG: hypothetical protein HKM07_05600 [Chlamydiae bacterium]|nr:hypothetical protein [Chlamydiota bacterium]
MGGGEGGLIYNALQGLQHWELEIWIFTWLGLILLLCLALFVWISYSSKDKLVKTTSRGILGIVAGLLIYSAFSYGNRVGLEKFLLVYAAIPIVTFLLIKSVVWSFYLFTKFSKSEKREMNFIYIFGSLFVSFVIGSLIVGWQLLG